MRKLTHVCLLAGACTAIFLGCQKHGILSFDDLTTPSLQQHVLAYESQSIDFQHITAKNLIETAQLTAPISSNLTSARNKFPVTFIPPTPTTSNSNARFVITYFSPSEGEKDTTFNEPQLLAALLNAEVSLHNALRRTNCLYKTKQCSPSALTETARLIASTLPSHTEGAFICTLFKPFEDEQLVTLEEKTSRHNVVSKIMYKKKDMNEKVKAVNRLIGVSGSVAAFGSTQITLYFHQNNAQLPAQKSIEAQEIRRILKKLHGDTEGDALYLHLILGQLTEESVWLLFENDIVPEWRKTNDEQPNGPLARLSFRYNYVEILGSVGRVGFSVYDLEGYSCSTELVPFR
jgi:hypothetical protein